MAKQRLPGRLVIIYYIYINKKITDENLTLTKRYLKNIVVT
jgi:hypothetical protein